jgi:hypothetical protein
MKRSLGALWTDKLEGPIAQLFAAARTKVAASGDVQSVRSIVATLDAEHARMQASARSAVTSLAEGLRLRVSELSHTTIRKLLFAGKRIVDTVVDSSVQRALRVSASAVGMSAPHTTPLLRACGSISRR